MELAFSFFCVTSTLFPISNECSLNLLFQRGDGCRAIGSFSEEIYLGPSAVSINNNKEACEAASHDMREIFDEADTYALLLVDTSNAFNSFNRKVLLHNIKYTCPPMSNYDHNCYSSPSRLFITWGKEILSFEGTTQGDPFAMPAYAVGIFLCCLC